MPFSFHFGPGFGGFQQDGEGPDFSQFQQERPQRPRKARKPIGNAFTRTLLNIGVTLGFALVYFYLELPALNFHLHEYWGELVLE